MDPDQLREQLLALPEERRAEIAHLLIESLSPAGDSDPDAKWQAELERRADEIARGVAEGPMADDVFDEIRQKYS